MSRENQMERNGDGSRLAQLANSPLITLSARIASVAVAMIVSLLVFIASGSLKTLDKVADKVEGVSMEVQSLSREMVKVVTKTEAQDKRIEKVENKVFK